ncbi:MAG: hypothetical protein HBSAPP04_00730 [Ignavibacteriaceae bacterium]|nr:MAG: hypothetical protein HBSAPP04_00730 [Ignavibacteriaceae bacterium]
MNMAIPKMLKSPYISGKKGELLREIMECKQKVSDASIAERKSIVFEAQRLRSQRNILDIFSLFQLIIRLFSEPA